MMERVPQPVREMLALLRESGHTPCLVGGCVRDRLLRERGVDAPTGDIDWVVTGASPEQMVAAGYLPVGADFPVFLRRQARHDKQPLRLYILGRLR